MSIARPPQAGSTANTRGVNGYISTYFNIFISVALLLYLSMFAYFLYATTIRIPFSDMFDYITDYLDYRQNGDLLQYLWMPHAQHRLVWTRLVTAFDIAAVNGVGYPFIVVSTTCLISVPLLIRREINHSGMLPEVTYVGGLLTVMLVLTTANVADCSIPIEDIYPQTLVFAVLAIVLFDGDLEGGGQSNYRRAAALLAAVGSAFGSATGLVVWPILLWAAWRGRVGRPWMIAVLATGTAFVGLYAHGLPVSQSTSEAPIGVGQFYAPTHLLKMAEYLLTYMGLPWTRAARLIFVGRLIGAVLLALGFIAIAQRGLLRRPADRLQRIAISLIMFSLATATLATIGRVDERADVEVPVRYSIYLAPLHIGLLCLLMPWLNRRWQVLSERRVIQVTVVLVVALLLVQQVTAGQAATTNAQTIAAAMSRFFAGERDAEMIRYVGSLERAEYAVALMKREAIYIGRH